MSAMPSEARDLLFARLEEKADSSGNTSPRNDTHDAFGTPYSRALTKTESVQEFLDSHFCLPKNALQDRNWQIKAVVTGNVNPKMRLFRMPQMNVAPD